MPTNEVYERCSVAEWEKKAELALMNGDVGEAMKFAHYANQRSLNSETAQEGNQ